MKRLAFFIIGLLFSFSAFSQEKINIQFDIKEQYNFMVGEKIDLINPKSTHKMHLSFDGNFLKIDYSSGKNFLMEKVYNYTVGYTYDEYSKKLNSKYYLLDILFEGKHLYYKIEFSQLSSSVQKSIYIPHMTDGLILYHLILQSDFYFGEEISN